MTRRQEGMKRTGAPKAAQRENTAGPRLQERPAEQPRESAAVGPDVLVVEDDRDLQDTIVGILEDEGIRCHGITNAWEAIDWIAAHDPRVVILDMMMPRMNGWEFLEHRKRDPKLAAVPVIVVTAAAQARVEKIPVEEVLVKPVGRTELVSSVRRYL